MTLQLYQSKSDTMLLYSDDFLPVEYLSMIASVVVTNEAQYLTGSYSLSGALAAASDIIHLL